MCVYILYIYIKADIIAISAAQADTEHSKWSIYKNSNKDVIKLPSNVRISHYIMEKGNADNPE